MEQEQLSLKVLLSWLEQLHPKITYRTEIRPNNLLSICGYVGRDQSHLLWGTIPLEKLERSYMDSDEIYRSH